MIDARRTTPPVPAAMMRHLVLTPDQMQWEFPCSIILVVASGGAHEVRLSLYAPGLKHEASLRQTVADKLGNLILGLNPEWVYEVKLEGVEVVVAIDNPAFLGDETIDLILGPVVLILRALAICEGRPLFTVRNHQRLVPVDCGVGNDYKVPTFELKLPLEIELAGAQDDLTKVAKRCPGAVALDTLVLGGARKLVVTFDAMKPRPSEQDLRRLVVSLLASIAEKASTQHPNLVLQPARPYTVEIDDGGPSRFDERQMFGQEF
ncbi:MAG TPA: hypothetical protein VMT30_05400 [Candidatus Saccharimonadia bacterium]|nr:hypothetical protein [Candidatus Saccharimonadia bacterium]